LRFELCVQTVGELMLDEVVQELRVSKMTVIRMIHRARSRPPHATSGTT
jgi:hypothetical protein